MTYILFLKHVQDVTILKIPTINDNKVLFFQAARKFIHMLQTLIAAMKGLKHFENLPSNNAHFLSPQPSV
jgi:hypothetical protein